MSEHYLRKKNPFKLPGQNRETRACLKGPGHLFCSCRLAHGQGVRRANGPPYTLYKKGYLIEESFETGPGFSQKEFSFYQKSQQQIAKI
jgi:hypothetical protein